MRPDVTPEGIRDWVKKAVVGKLCAPTAYHILAADDEYAKLYADGYDAINNPPDVLELAFEYLKLAEQIGLLGKANS